MTWHNIGEIVGVIAGIATTLIAAFTAWVAYQTLLRTPSQKTELEESERVK